MTNPLNCDLRAAIMLRRQQGLHIDVIARSLNLSEEQVVTALVGPTQPYSQWVSAKENDRAA